MKISIIMPVYNKGKYLRTILNQVKEQTFKEFECLLIDDGSFDGSEKTCDEFAKLDSRFRAFHISNSGVSKARNVGLDNAKGDYITFIDADDEIQPDYLENMYCKLTESNADMLIGSIMKFWDGSCFQKIVNVPYEGVHSSIEVFFDFAKHQYDNGIFGFCCGKIIKSSIAKSYRFDEKLCLAEDLDYYISIYPRIERFYFDKVALYCYRQDADNSSMQCADDKIDYFAQLVIQVKVYHMLKRMGVLEGNNKDLVESRILDYIFFTIYHSPIENLKEVINAIRLLPLPVFKQRVNRSWRQRFILMLFAYNADWMIVFVLLLRSTIKRLVF